MKKQSSTTNSTKSHHGVFWWDFDGRGDQLSTLTHQWFQNPVHHCYTFYSFRLGDDLGFSKIPCSMAHNSWIQDGWLDHLSCLCKTRSHPVVYIQSWHEPDPLVGFICGNILWYSIPLHRLACIMLWLTMAETKCGLGKHSLTVTPEQSVGLLKVNKGTFWNRDIQNWLNQAFVYEGPNFFTGVCLTQLSILLLYKRVFTVNTPWFRYSLYGLALACVIICIVFFCTVVFSCAPIRGLWDKSLDPKCYELRNVYIAHTALILAIDIAIVAVPMRIVWNLHANAATKGAVAGLFLLGSLSVPTLSRRQVVSQ